MKIFNHLYFIKSKFTNPLLRNSLFNSAGFVFISLIALIITPLLVKNFGVEQYGIYILITGFLGYYGIFDFGLGQALIKFVSQYNAQNDYQKLNDAVNSVFWFQLIVGLVLSSLLLFFSNEIIGVLNVSDRYFGDSTTALKIASIGFFFSMLAATFNAAIKGLERYDLTSTTDLVSNLILNILLLAVVFHGYGITEAVWVNVGIAIFQLLLYFIFFKRISSGYKLRFTIKWPLVSNFFSFSGYLFLSKISGILRQHGTRLIISVLLNPSAVTLYVVPSKLLGAVGGILSSATATLFPFISKIHTLKSNIKLKETFIKYNIVFINISIPIMIFVFIFAKAIMTIWMGESFANKSWFVLSILTIGSFFGSLTTIPINTILGMGISKLILVFSLFNLILYSLLLPTFSYLYGIIGTAVAMALVSFINIFIVLYKTIQVIGINFKNYLKKVFKPHLFPLCINLISAFLIMIFFNNLPIINLIIGLLILMIYLFFINIKSIKIIF